MLSLSATKGAGASHKLMARRREKDCVSLAVAARADGCCRGGSFGSSAGGAWSRGGVRVLEALVDGMAALATWLIPPNTTTHVRLSSLCKFAKNVCAGRVEWKDVRYGRSWLEPDVVAAPEEPRTKPRAASCIEEDSVKVASLNAVNALHPVSPTATPAQSVTPQACHIAPLPDTPHISTPKNSNCKKHFGDALRFAA